MTRDVHGLLVLFVMPAAFILIMSLALRDTFQPHLEAKVHWAALDRDGSPVAAAVLAHMPPADPRAHPQDRAAIEAALARGNIQAVVVLDPGFGARLTDPQNTRTYAHLLLAPQVPSALASAFQSRLQQAMVIERVRHDLSRALGPEAGGGQDAFAQASRLGPLLAIERAGSGVHGLSAVQQSVPAWLIFAMFFVVIPLSNIFIAEKRQGTLSRLRSLRVPLPVVLAGKIVPFYFINLAQTAVMLLVGRFVVPLLGGDALLLDCDWWALGCLASAVSLAAIGFALALASLARTTEQATTCGGVANILFGALGGVMVPKLVMPAAMQQATVLSPMAWGLDGFLAIFTRGAHLSELGRPIAALLLMAALGVSVTVWRLSRLD